MTSEELKQTLKANFCLVDMIDLADLSSSPGGAYKFFKSVYRPEYTANCRIVIYTNQSVDDDLIAHLYQTANFIDVSNWFVLVCSTQDMSQQLANVCNVSSTDSIPFQNFVVPLEDCKVVKNNFRLPETICAIPWSNIEVSQRGKISPCCMSSYDFGNIANDTLEDVFYGKDMNNLRQSFLNGEKPAGCQRCWLNEQRGVSSIRQHNIKRLKEKFLTEYLDDPKIAYLDLKFQNTCNFKCRICGSESSSLFAEEQRQHLKIEPKAQLKWSEDDNFVNQINALLPQIANIDMYGGEPFLIKKFSAVLERAVNSNVANNIRLHYNSNGSIWPEMFIPYWPHFKQVDIHFSIDAVGKRFELQRGGSWSEVESNILRIKNLGLENLNISIMPSVSVMSVYYLDEVIDWAELHGFQIFTSHVTNPSNFSLSGLTQEAKDLVLNKFKDHPWPEFKNMLELIKAAPVSDGKSFCKKTQWFDTVRKENFSESHPEIAKAMGYLYNINL